MPRFCLGAIFLSFWPTLGSAIASEMDFYTYRNFPPGDFANSLACSVKKLVRSLRFSVIFRASLNLRKGGE